MIFGASRAITRKNSQIESCHALVVDITDVKHLGVSAALSLEESILDMVRADRLVYIVASDGQPLQRFAKMGILKNIPEENIIKAREAALEQISAKLIKKS
jgi:SulP family sulfate permease